MALKCKILLASIVFLPGILTGLLISAAFCPAFDAVTVRIR
jgi:hypothetical protein